MRMWYGLMAVAPLPLWFPAWGATGPAAKAIVLALAIGAGLGTVKGWLWGRGVRRHVLYGERSLFVGRPPGGVTTVVLGGLLVGIIAYLLSKMAGGMVFLHTVAVAVGGMGIADFMVFGAALWRLERTQGGKLFVASDGDLFFFE